MLFRSGGEITHAVLNGSIVSKPAGWDAFHGLTEEIRATLINLFEDKIVCADCGKKLYFPVSYTHLDVYKRQPLYNAAPHVFWSFLSRFKDRIFIYR